MESATTKERVTTKIRAKVTTMVREMTEIKIRVRAKTRIDLTG
jgi:hypothetical protein